MGIVVLERETSQCAQAASGCWTAIVPEIHVDEGGILKYREAVAQAGGIGRDRCCGAKPVYDCPRGPKDSWLDHSCLKAGTFRLGTATVIAECREYAWQFFIKVGQ